MPVRSLSSRVLRWPDAETVRGAALAWAQALVARAPKVIAVGYFGSYARGDAGVGSDIDLVVLVHDSDRPFESRVTDWRPLSLPVPADVLVYTLSEWECLPQRSPRFAHTLAEETVWLAGGPPVAAGP